MTKDKVLDSESSSDSPSVPGICPPYPVIACSIVFFWSISIRVFIFTVMPTIADDLHLSSSAAGLAISCVLLGYCTGNWVAGWSPLSRKSTIVASMLIAMLGAAMFSLARDFPTIMAAGCVLGLGTGIYLPLGLTLIMDSGGAERKGYYLSVHEVAASIGSFTGASIVALLLQWAGWPKLILLWCCVGLAATVIFTMMRDGGKRRKADDKVGAKVSISWKLVELVTVYAVCTLLVMGLVSLLPLIMVRAWGVSQVEAASLVGTTRLAGLMGVIVMGLFSDRLGHGRVLLCTQSFCLIGCSCMAVGGYGLLFQIGMAVMSFGASANVGLIPAIIAGSYPAAQRQRAMAVANSTGGLLGLVVSPALFGALLDFGYPIAPLFISAAASAVMIFLTHRLAAKVE